MPIIVLHGDHCYSTQLHLEGTCKTLSTVCAFWSPRDY